jgi:hypothetical protein
MATSKYLRKYAKGGNPRFTQANDGLRAMQQQSKTIVDGLKTAALQQKQQDELMISGMDRKFKNEAENRKLLNEIEVETPFKLQKAALDRNKKSELKSLSDQAKEYDKLAGVWGRLSPTLAKEFQGLAQNTKDFINTNNAIDDFNRMSSDGTLDNVYYLYDKVNSGKAYDDAVNALNKNYKAAFEDNKLDAKADFDYLQNKLKINNPITQKLIVKDLTDNFSRQGEDIKGIAQQMGLDLTKNNITKLYQFRSLEILKQLGINPKSEAGFKIQELFRTKGLVQENQLTLETDYMKLSETIDGGLKEIQAATDYTTRNAKWKEIQTSIYALPTKDKNGVYSRQLTVNPKEVFLGWAKDQADNKMYQGVGGWEKFKSEVLGVTAENEYGYEITGATGNKNAKFNRILGKFPNMEDELYEYWSDADKKNAKAKEYIEDNKYKADAVQYQTKLEKGQYKNKDGTYNDAFWNDWYASNGNKHARAVFAGTLGYADDKHDINTLNSTVIQAYKNNDFATVYAAWSKMDEADQTIGFIYEDLKELAYAKGVELNQLDNTLLQQMKTNIDKVYKHGTLDRTKDTSSNDIHKDALGEALALYRNSKGKGNANERWDLATSTVDRMLGIGPDGELMKWSDDDYRGSGPFLQKKSKSMGVIFVKNSGQQFGNLSSIEIDDKLKGNFNRELTGETRANALTDLIETEWNAKRISQSDYINFLEGKPQGDLFLNHLLTDQMGDVDPILFANNLKEKTKDLALDVKTAQQWNADTWCRAQGYPQGFTPQVAFEICVGAFEAQTGQPAWKSFLNPAITDRYLNNE